MSAFILIACHNLPKLGRNQFLWLPYSDHTHILLCATRTAITLNMINTLKTDALYFNNIFVTGCKKNYFNNSLYRQWRKFRQFDITFECSSLYPDSKVDGANLGPTPGAHLGPVGPRWAPCWPHEPCCQGITRTWPRITWLICPEVQDICVRDHACCVSIVRYMIFHNIGRHLAHKLEKCFMIVCSTAEIASR